MIAEQLLRELAVQYAPDYPGIETCEIWECAWAIRACIEGTNKANDDLHRLIKKLQSRLKMDVHEVIALGLEARAEGESTREITERAIRNYQRRHYGRHTSSNQSR